MPPKSAIGREWRAGWFDGCGYFNAGLLLFAALFASAPSAKSQEYEVSGSIKHAFADNSRQNEIYSFQAFLKGTNWLIAITNSTHNHGYARTQLASDGEDVYRVIEYTPQWIAASRATLTNTEYATIFPGLFPTNVNMVEKLVWLGFASRDYFNAVTNLSIKGAFWGRMLLGEEFNSTTVSFVPGDTLPQKIETSRGGFNLAFSSKRSSGFGSPEFMKLPLLPPNDTGFVSVGFSVVASTNIGKISLPVAFRCELFSCKNLEKESERRMTSKYELTVTEVHPVCSRELLLPTLFGIGDTRDYRAVMRPGMSHHYVTENSQWLTRADPHWWIKISEEERRYMKSRREQKAP
jgi:hypothetical protein